MQTKPTPEQILSFAEEETDDLEVVYEGEWETDYKYQTLETVYLHKESSTYWMVTQQRTNVGHWGDPDYLDSTIGEVKPVKKMIEVTQWVTV